MSFDLTVVFTGVLAFVKNLNGASKARLCVLAPNASSTSAVSSLDGAPLARHQAFVRFPIDQVSSLDAVHGRDSLGIWYLHRQRLFIETVDDLTAGSPDANDFRIVDTGLPPGEQYPQGPPGAAADAASFSWMLDMPRVCGGFQVDASLLSDRATSDRLTAQIFLGRGTVSTKTLTNVVWTFDSCLNPRLQSEPYTRVLAHEVMVQYVNLSAARLKAVNMDTGCVQYLDLTGLQRDRQLQITIDNTCDDNPLEWPRDYVPRPDHDSRWVYELLEPSVAAGIKQVLAAQGKTLPIPLPERVLASAIGSPGSGNCIPPRLNDALFDVVGMD